MFFTFTYLSNAGVVGAPQITSQLVSSIFLSSPLPSWTWWAPGLSIPWCCLSVTFFCLPCFLYISLCLARCFWPDLMNGRHAHTISVFVSLGWKIWNRVDCQRSEKWSKTHKRLKERFLIRRNRTKRANFRCNHLWIGLAMHLFRLVRRSSCGSIVCWILADFLIGNMVFVWDA